MARPRVFAGAPVASRTFVEARARCPGNYGLLKMRASACLGWLDTSRPSKVGFSGLIARNVSCASPRLPRARAWPAQKPWCNGHVQFGRPLPHGGSATTPGVSTREFFFIVFQEIMPGLSFSNHQACPQAPIHLPDSQAWISAV